MSGGITALSLGVTVLFVLAVLSVCRRRAAFVAAGASAAWLTLSYALSASGLLARFDLHPPPFVFMFVTVIAGGLALGLSPLGKALSRVSLVWLVGVHAFRLPLELLMHQAAVEGVMPVTMSYSGYNFDIVTGASAALLAALIARGKAPRALVVAFNALGSVLLVVIAAVAFAGTPMIRAFGDAPEDVNSWVAHPPFVWLPAILVLAAIAGHVIVARRLLAEPAKAWSTVTSAPS